MTLQPARSKSVFKDLYFDIHLNKTDLTLINMASVFHKRLIQIVVLLIVAAEIAPADVTVKTNVGYITGTRRDVELDGTVFPIVKFLGIPYAEPPTGYYRFRPPRPKAPFSEPLMAHEHGSR